MLAYAPIYAAGCLKDPQTSMYCFANAVTNISSPANMYVYYLPLNQSYIGSAIPACNTCLQQTMAIFQAATANRNQFISNTYESAASQINLVCGPGFAGERLAVELVPSSGAVSGRTGASSLWMMFSVPLLAILPWLL